MFSKGICLKYIQRRPFFIDISSVSLQFLGVGLANAIGNHLQQLKFSLQMASLDLQWTATIDPYF